ncbi:MAG: DUF711 family protein [Anaerolineae bacterium]|nr:DUF711 family protein [Anaerolineae bacterium]
MKIRSVTHFIPLTWPIDEGSIAGAGRFLADARLRLTKAGFEVQTVRLATPPFLDVLGDPDAAVLLEFAKTLEEMAAKHNIDFVSIGPVVATTPLSLLMSIHALPQVIAETEKIFSGVLFAADNSGINFAAAQALAQTVHKVAHATPMGFGNLRLGALANVPAGVPFFPAAYHHGGAACFAIATEAADLALDAISSARSFPQAQKRLITAIESATNNFLGIVDALVDDHQLRFKGLDFSLAPFPTQARSIGAAVEKLGIDSFGGSGTLFAISFLTNCIRQANIPHTGFSGVLLPLLEDNVLAERAAECCFDINDLLLYSAVCGTGLSTIPIPGNTTADEMAAIFVDMAALAITLHKPLTARLMPIPGLAVGEKVTFDFEYFASSRVMPVKNLGARRLFEKGSFFAVSSQP